MILATLLFKEKLARDATNSSVSPSRFLATLVKNSEFNDRICPYVLKLPVSRLDPIFIGGQTEGTIECETMQAGNADIQLIQNVRKALEAGFKWVLIVVLDEKGQRLATKALEEFQFFEGKAKVKLVWELL